MKKTDKGKTKRSRRLRRAGLILLCLVLLMNLCSCWNRRELNTLSIVLGTALDLGDQPDTLKLTAQVVKAGEIRTGMSGSDSGVPKEKAYLNIQETDRSMLAVLRKMTRMTNRKLYFPHNKILIIGKELAEQGISEGLDAFMRDNETRMNVYILVAKGEAYKALDEELELEKVPAIHLFEMVENQKFNSEIVQVTLRDFAIATLSTSKSPVAPLLETYEYNGKKKTRIEGTAVFKGGKMIGELDKAQTRGLLWATDQAKSSIITVDTQWGQVTLEIVHSSSSLKPVKMKDGTIRMKLKISEDGYIQENETNEKMTSSENIELLKQQGSQVIVTDVQNALEQARSLSADVFGFGEAIRRDFPDDWKKFEANWDEMFSDIELDINVELTLHSTGALAKPVVPGGAK